MEDNIRHLVISGGGSTGLAFYSILRDSEKCGYWRRENIKTIWCTSVGSIGAVLIAVKPHFSWEDLDGFIINRPWEDIFQLNMDKLLKSYSSMGILDKSVAWPIISPLLKAIDLKESVTLEEFYEVTGVEIHFFTVELSAYELVDISYKTHPKWRLIDAMYCTYAIPGLVAPYKCELDGKMYMDGGFICNCPLRPCLNSGCLEDEIFCVYKHIEPTNPCSLNTIVDYMMYIAETAINKMAVDVPKIKHAIYIADKSANPISICTQMSSLQYRLELANEGSKQWQIYHKCYLDNLVNSLHSQKEEQVPEQENQNGPKEEEEDLAKEQIHCLANSENTPVIITPGPPTAADAEINSILPSGVFA